MKLEDITKCGTLGDSLKQAHHHIHAASTSKDLGRTLAELRKALCILVGIGRLAEEILGDEAPPVDVRKN